MALEHILWTKFAVSRSAQRARSVMSTMTGLAHSEYKQTLVSTSDVSLSEHTDFNHWFWGSIVRRANNVMLQHTFRWNAIMLNFQHRPITDGCTGKIAQVEYLHKSDMLGIVGRTVGGVVFGEAVGKTVGAMVDSTLDEGAGVVIGKRVMVESVGETVAGTLVRDEERARLKAVGIFVDAERDGVSKMGMVDVFERMTMGNDEEEEALLEHTGKTVDGERSTLDEIVDLKIRGIVGEIVANVDRVVETSDGERVVLETVATVVGEAEDEVMEISGVAGETVVLETIGGPVGELLNWSVQYLCTQ